MQTTSYSGIGRAAGALLATLLILFFFAPDASARPLLCHTDDLILAHDDDMIARAIASSFLPSLVLTTSWSDRAQSAVGPRRRSTQDLRHHIWRIALVWDISKATRTLRALHAPSVLTPCDRGGMS